MSELGIDGFAISGKDAVLRVLDRESMSGKFAILSLDVASFSKSEFTRFRRSSLNPAAWSSSSHRLGPRFPRPRLGRNAQ